MTTALTSGIRRATARLAPDSTPDGQLLARFLSERDEGAFAALVRRHAAMVFGTCRRVLGNAADADDAFQAAFVVLVRKAHSLTDRACVGNYLYGVAFHTALKAKAMATKRRAKEIRAKSPLPTSTDTELTAILDEELAHLPEKYREPVVLCELEGVSRKDAATRLGVPEGTISSRLATAHRMLEKRLKGRGVAAVGVAAVLAGQALASADRVSDKLADAAVRAATTGGPAGVTHLVAEVTKMFLLNKLKAGAAVLAGVVLLLGVGVGLVQRGVAADTRRAMRAPVPEKKAEAKDEDRLQGLWQAESLEADGKKAPDEAAKGFHIRFKRNAITFVSDDRTHTFELDATAKPKALNLTPGDGDAKGKKLECAIYELDGDTLKICIDKEGDHGKRPTEFKTAPGDGLALIVLKRVKEKAAKPDDKKLLVGKWVSKAVTFDPPLPPAPVLAGPNLPQGFAAVTVIPIHEFIFTDTELTWASFNPPRPGVAVKKTGWTQKYQLDETANPKELTANKQQLVYKLDGDTLTVAMYFASGERPKGFTAKDSPPPKGAHLMVIELTREKDDAKKPDVDKEYSLQDGEVLKLIPSPFPAEREKVFARIPASKRTGSPSNTNLLAVAVGDGADEVTECASRRLRDEVRPPQLLHYVQHVLQIDTTAVSDPNWLLESTVLDADVVFRKGAKPEDVLAALSKELKAKCGADVTFAFREAETEVVVLSGKHGLKRNHAFPGRPYNDAAWVKFTDKPLASSGGRGTAQLPAALSTFVGRPVIDESDLKNNDAAVWITYPGYDIRPKAEDRDPAKVLKSFAEQTGVTAKLEKRTVKAVVVEQPKQEPAWKAEFRKVYGLKAGELVKRVAPPYPDCRETYYKNLFPGRQGNIPFDQWFTVFGWSGSWVDEKLGQRTMPIKPDEGVPLERLLDMTLKFPKTRVESDQTTLGRMVTGDFVVRAGADPEKVAGQLEAILRKELSLPVKFTFKDAEEEVFVLGGKYAAKPLDDRKAGEVEVYAIHLTDRKTGGGGSGTLKEMLAAVERHVNKPVVLGQVEGEPKKVQWHYNVRQPMLRDPAKGIDTYAEDTNPAAVLDRLAEQTGLTVKTEKRKVRTLVAEFAEVKK